MEHSQMRHVATIYVSASGNDAYGEGSLTAPFATLQRARDQVRQMPKDAYDEIQVLFREGTYYFSSPAVFTAEDSGTEHCPIIYSGFPGESVTFSGGKKLTPHWEPYQKGIFRTRVPDDIASFGQLFVNGERQILARHPNRDDSLPGKSGYITPVRAITDEAEAEGCGDIEKIHYTGEPAYGIVYNPETLPAAKWAHPEKAVIHIFQAMYWGNLQFRLRGCDPERHALWFGEGGTQMGAKWYENPCEIDENSRFFIENVFEELDAPGEWFFDEEARWLYYYPQESLDLKTALFEVSQLESVLVFQGTQKAPVTHISIRGVRIAHTEKTFLEEYDVPSLGDWSIHRGGAVYLEGTRDCHITGCQFDSVGGNGVFFNGHNLRSHVTGNYFYAAGDSAVCLVGISSMIVGHQRYFPCECTVTHNIIHHCGEFGKQVAGVFLSIAKRITVGHNLIFHMPRAGICLNDGTWGGHIIEFNRVFDTCLETGDHGPFNAWGRDRYWCLLHSHGPLDQDTVCHQAGNIFADQMETVIVRNNFFEDHSGWGLDLDDGASNYHIYNNLCVGISMKLREGAYRLIENNIWVNGANSPCFHVGNVDNHDRYVRNITVMNTNTANPENDLNFSMGRHYGEFYTLIKPPCKGPWLEEIDYNLFYNNIGSFSARVITGEMGTGKKYKFDLQQWQELGYDLHSVFADPCFVNPEENDYRVAPHSPAVQLGFKNFSMSFGPDEQYRGNWAAVMASHGVQDAR